MGATIITKTAATLAAGISALTLTTGIAAAQPHTVEEHAYLIVLDQYGITYTSETDAINAGHTICNARRNGMTEMQIAKIIHNSSPLSLNDGAYLIGAAEAAFCPNMLGK